MTRLINIDNGGTLTDFCLVDGDEVRYTKTLTTPYDLSRCLFDGLTKVSELAYSEPRLAALLQSTDCIRYSTTQGTNALVQRAGPQLGLLVTDATLIEGLAATQAQEDLLAALVGDRWGRISLDADDEALGRELLARVNDLSARGARRLVIAVSGADGSEDEARVKGLLLRLYPRHLLGAVPLLFSWELVADPDDIRRTWSGLLNAFLHPAMERFLFNADRRLRDVRARQRHGPAELDRRAADHPLRAGSRHLGERAPGRPGGPGERGGHRHGRHQLRHRPGPGRRGEALRLHAGHRPVAGQRTHDPPGDAGRRGRIHRQLRPAAPVGQGRPAQRRVGSGPACYDRGGLLPTVTDADLLLGYLTPERYAGGQIKLNRQRAEFAIDEEFGDHLDLDPVEVARLIKAEVDEQMANGLAKELRIRGYLPAEFTMLAYGGNGPLHCCGIAAHLGMDKILAPPYSSVFSALGAGNMPQLHIHERSAPLILFDATNRAIFTDFGRFNAIVAELEAKGHADLQRQGLPADAVRHRLELDMRYGNQLVTMAVVASKTRLESIRDVVDLMRLFSDDYGRRFGEGSQSPEAGIRVTALRVASFVQGETIEFDATPPDGRTTAAQPAGSRRCFFPRTEGPVETAVFDENALEPGLAVPGPAVVTTPTTTYLVEPGWRIETGAHGAIWFLANSPEKKEDQR